MCFPVHIICDKPKCIFPAVENSKLSADYCILYLPCTFSVIRDIRNPARCPIQAKQCLSLMKDRIGFSKGDQSFHKSKQIFITFLSSPVQPCGLIVLTIHIVIPILCVSKLISRQNAWCSLRKQKQKKSILHLIFAKCHHTSFSAWSFRTAVPTVIIIRTVLIALSVCLIMLPVIRDQVTECKPCM